MAAKHDIQRGINAEVGAGREAVVEACARAVATLGKHGRSEATSQVVTVQILPGMSQKLSSISPIVEISLKPAAQGRISVSTKVTRYRTSQSKLFAFIPMGPKTLVGKSYFVKFLNALETELRALDPAGSQVHHTTA